MLRILLLVLGLGAAASLLSERPFRQKLMELAKEASDVAVSLLLRSTSQFGSELSREGRAEQQMWGEYRERDVRVRGKTGRA